MIMYIPMPVLVTVEGLSTLSMNSLLRTLSAMRYVNMPIPIPLKMLLAGSKMHKIAANIPNPALIQYMTFKGSNPNTSWSV